MDNGDNTYGGKYVVNPSGGLISKGHPLGATGLAQCAELNWQVSIQPTCIIIILLKGAPARKQFTHVGMPINIQYLESLCPIIQDYITGCNGSITSFSLCSACEH